MATPALALLNFAGYRLKLLIYLYLEFLTDQFLPHHERHSKEMYLSQYRLKRVCEVFFRHKKSNIFCNPFFDYFAKPAESNVGGVMKRD